MVPPGEPLIRVRGKSSPYGCYPVKQTRKYVDEELTALDPQFFKIRNKAPPPPPPPPPQAPWVPQ
jgi:hypothetical protein